MKDKKTVMFWVLLIAVSQTILLLLGSWLVLFYQKEFVLLLSNPKTEPLIGVVGCVVSLIFLITWIALGVLSSPEELDRNEIAEARPHSSSTVTSKS